MAPPFLPLFVNFVCAWIVNTDDTVENTTKNTMYDQKYTRRGSLYRLTVARTEQCYTNKRGEIKRDRKIMTLQ